MRQGVRSQAARRFELALVLLMPMVLGCLEPTAPAPVDAALVDVEPAAFDWSALGLAWQRYEANPTTVTAEAVRQRLPATRLQPGVSADERLVREILYRSIQDTQGGALARQVAAGDDQAVALAFDLLVVADGALAEELQQILGSLVTVDAHLFLAEAARHSALVPQPGMLVMALGQAFVDRQAEADAEVARRVAALAAVDDPVLRPLRDACLEALLPPRQILITGEPTGASLPGSSGLVPVTIANHGADPIRLRRSLRLERQEEGGFTDLTATGEVGAIWVRTGCEPRDGVVFWAGGDEECVTVAAGGTIEIAPWLGTLGDAQCICERCVTAPPGTYRLSARACDGGGWIVGEPFTLVASALAAPRLGPTPAPGRAAPPRGGDR
ncbi:MAG: hypothetical protein ABIO70_29255 [Pseudomonadota bacterium]